MTKTQHRRTTRDNNVRREWQEGLEKGCNRTQLRQFIEAKYLITTSTFYLIIREK
jgi:hypothetical protein